MKRFGGLVLAGGKSARMGADKAALTYKGRTLLEHMSNLLSMAGAAPVLRVGFGGELVDPMPDCGPAAGVIALADHVAANPGVESWLVVPVDMPLLTPALLKRLADVDAPAAHFVDMTLPLAITLSPDVAAAVQRTRGDLQSEHGVSLWRLLRDVGATAIAPTPAEMPCLINVNTPAEWQSLQVGG
jgi:molybdopterin-guanine dinucleotide biosynthesis protein A